MEVGMEVLTFSSSTQSFISQIIMIWVLILSYTVEHNKESNKAFIIIRICEKALSKYKNIKYNNVIGL